MLKKALLVGINDYPSAPLRGCENDVKQMKGLLTDLFGFNAEEIRLVLNKEATRNGIIEGLSWLAKGGSDDTVRVFHFAGHGHFVPDKNGDEPDGSDEALVPYDFTETGYLIDDELKSIYRQFSERCNLTLITDCCHSGTNQRAPHDDIVYRYLPVSYEERRAIAEAKRQFHRDQREFVHREMELARSERMNDDEFQRRIDAVLRKFEKQRYGDHRVREGNVLLAACQSDQKAADAQFGNSHHGAFTYCFAQVVREAEGKISYRAVAEKAGKLLYGQSFRQIPQLECDSGREEAPVFSVF